MKHLRSINEAFDFNKLEVLLQQNGLRFGDFNDAWRYIENDYNNR